MGKIADYADKHANGDIARALTEVIERTGSIEKAADAMGVQRYAVFSALRVRNLKVVRETRVKVVSDVGHSR